ncbi:unnamed protein product [Paramecium octaurelia]|uniref:Uncharacterized protein n=1 Tax=Paramecium octaurelia TaxID=43137 RepID=A0A8S1SR79_PAROT|nr:unnamed protein product [Paramecium octaurelia]
MFFNFNRFFGFQQKLDNLLKNESLTIETIFNEDDILQELKGSSSAKFADFLIQHPQEYKKMIGYIVNEINDDSLDKTCRTKYPFYSSEVLGQENEKLINFLFDKPEDEIFDGINNPIEDDETQQLGASDKNNNNQIEDQETQLEATSKKTEKLKENEEIRANLLDYLLQLLEDDALNVTTAGYFAKALNTIILKRGVCFWEHLKHNPQVISNLFKHCYLKHIVDIIDKLISLEDNYEQHNQYMNDRFSLLQRLAQILKGKDYSQVIVQNICELFEGQFRKAVQQQETQTQEYKKMLLHFVQQITPSFFMFIALQTQQAVAYNVIIAQLEFLNKMAFQNEHQDQIENTEKESLKIPDIAPLFSLIIKDFSKALNQQDWFNVSFTSTVGTCITPLGECKLSLIQLINNLLSKSELQNFYSSNIFQSIINLVKQHPSNNQLHLLFEKIVLTVFASNNEQLQKSMFSETNLITFIIENNNDDARKNKFGFQGVLTRLSNYLHQNATQSQQFQLTLQQTNSNWSQYMDGLNDVIKKEQEWILGVNPKQKTFQLSEEISSPNIIMPEPLVQYAYTQPSGFRKCESFENSDEDNEGKNEEEIQHEQQEQKIAQEPEAEIGQQYEVPNQNNNNQKDPLDLDSNPDVKEEIIQTSELNQPSDEEITEEDQQIQQDKENESKENLDNQIQIYQLEQMQNANEEVIHTQQVQEEDNLKPQENQPEQQHIQTEEKEPKQEEQIKQEDIGQQE